LHAGGKGVADPIIRRVCILASVVLLGWVLWLLQPILAPFIAAFLMAYLFSPLVERLEMWIKMPRWVAILVVFVVIGTGVTAAAWWLVPVMWDQLVYAKDHIPDAIRWINSAMRPWLKETFNIHTARIDIDQVSDWLVSYLQANYSATDTQAMLTNLARSGMNVLNVFGLVVLVPIVTFYFLLDWQGMLSRLQALIPRRHEPKMVIICQECNTVLGAFVKGQLLVMLLLGAVYAGGLELVGIKVGLIIGMVAGLASIIPYLGFAVGLIAAIVACLFQFGLDWMHLALVGSVFMIGQIVEGYILQPFLLGDKIGLSPVAVIFAVMAGAQLMGLAGMLLALPIAAVLVVLMRHLHHSYVQSLFYNRQTTVLPRRQD
jgi:predicted PurR-regulated permease PerM